QHVNGGCCSADSRIEFQKSPERYDERRSDCSGRSIQPRSCGPSRNTRRSNPWIPGTRRKVREGRRHSARDKDTRFPRSLSVPIALSLATLRRTSSRCFQSKCDTRLNIPSPRRSQRAHFPPIRTSFVAVQVHSINSKYSIHDFEKCEA